MTDFCYYCQTEITQANYAGEIEVGGRCYDGLDICDDIHHECVCVGCAAKQEAA